MIPIRCQEVHAAIRATFQAVTPPPGLENRLLMFVEALEHSAGQKDVNNSLGLGPKARCIGGGLCCLTFVTRVKHPRHPRATQACGGVAEEHASRVLRQLHHHCTYRNSLLFSRVQQSASRSAVAINSSDSFNSPPFGCHLFNVLF